MVNKEPSGLTAAMLQRQQGVLYFRIVANVLLMLWGFRYKKAFYNVTWPRHGLVKSWEENQFSAPAVNSFTMLLWD